MKKEKNPYLSKLKKLTLFIYLAFLLFGFISTTMAQQGFVVSGTVTDPNADPLPGVNIVVKGTTQGTVTDNNGRFSITLKSRNETLVFSFIGFETKEVKADKPVINVVLHPSAIGLDEFVAIGYGSQRKKDLTGAVSRADLTNVEANPSVTLGEMLKGTVPGLNIGQVNRAGQNPSISIRGRTTIGGNRNVLIVVDGIIFNGSLAELNPMDIESVDVLKDASSKAIYGAQAANGVILITTKKGGIQKGKKPVITYSNLFSIETPTADIETYDAAGFEQKNRNILWRDAYTAESGYLEVNPNFDYKTEFNNYSLQTEVTEGLEKGVDYNWFDALTSPGKVTKHNLSVAGGSTNTKYLLSLGYTGQDGYILNDDYNKISGRVNIETDITDWLTIGTNSYLSVNDYSGEAVDFGWSTNMPPYLQPYDENGKLIPRWGLVVNPFVYTQNPDFDKRNSIFGKMFGKIKVPFVKGLTYTINYGNNYQWRRHYNSDQYDGAGVAYKYFASRNDMTLDNIVAYTKTFNSNHNLDVTLLYGIRENDYENTNAVGKNFTSLKLSYNSLELGESATVSSDAWKESFLYQMARASYNFKNTYYITGTIRRDGFSGFAPNNKTAVFPSLALAWIISNENFLKGVDYIDFLKLRLSYGKNGNLTNRYSSLALVASRPIYVNGSNTLIGQYPIAMENNNLKWETTTGINLGVDFDLLNDRLKGSVEYYNSVTNDLLFRVNVPNVTGFTSIMSNVGKIGNTGVELNLDATVMKKHDFSWDVGVVFATNKNEVLELPGKDNNDNGLVDMNASSTNSNFLEVGQSIGAIQNYFWDGFWQIDDYAVDSVINLTQIGSEKIIDQNDDGVIDEKDLRVIGRTEPAYRFSIYNNLKYKNFSFSFLINSVQGGKDGYLGANVTNAFCYLSMGHAITFNMPTQLDFWTPANTNPHGRNPSSTQVVKRFTQYHSRSFVRLQDVTLRYDFDDNILKKLNFLDLSVFVSGKNLLTFTDWLGWDPETGVGIAGGFPTMKSVSVGLNVSF